MSKEARFFTALVLAAAFCSLGAGYRTQNFIVTAGNPQLAQEIGEAAEAFRRDLAIEWLGGELPPWSDVCPITAQISPQLGAGGATSFYFNQGRPYGWRMTLQGSRERVLDSVLPHEITHTIFATHFGQPLPRWADEGACTTVEHPSEKHKQQQMLVQFLTTGRGIAFNQMFAMREYPSDILPLYSQGYSLARYLIAQGGKQKYVQYVGEGLKTNNWTAATRQHYGYSSLGHLQESWLAWVKQGSPATPATLLAAQPAAPQPTTVSPASTALAGNTAAGNRGATGSDDTLFASASDSWYARQRDHHQRGDSQSSGEPGADEAFSAAAEDAQAVPVRGMVGHAPEVGRPEPTVLPAVPQPLQPLVAPPQPLQQLPAQQLPPYAPGSTGRIDAAAALPLAPPTVRY